jgi:hypothetical protein
MRVLVCRLNFLMAKRELPMIKSGGFGLCLLALVGVACSDGGSGSATAGGGAGNATGASECQVKAASTNSSGVLSTYPNVSVSVTPAAFRATTLNFVVTEDGDSRGPLLEMFVELENAGTTTECNFLPAISLDGIELVGLVDTPPYFSGGLTTVTADCLGPGATGAIRALARGITSTEVAAATYLSIALGPSSFGTNLPASNPPKLTAEIAKLTQGWGVKGTVTPAANIYNYSITIFPRNSQGVLYAQLLAFPNELNTLALGTAVPFETDTVPCQFGDYALFDSWIVRN